MPQITIHKRTDHTEVDFVHSTCCRCGVQRTEAELPQRNIIEQQIEREIVRRNAVVDIANKENVGFAGS